MKIDTTLISLIEYEDLVQKKMHCRVLEHQLELIYDYAKHMPDGDVRKFLMVVAGAGRA